MGIPIIANSVRKGKFHHLPNLPQHIQGFIDGRQAHHRDKGRNPAIEVFCGGVFRALQQRLDDCHPLRSEPMAVPSQVLDYGCQPFLQLSFFVENHFL